jgi:hypothetical protein
MSYTYFKHPQPNYLTVVNLDGYYRNTFAKAIAANSTSIDSERKAIRELRRSIRESRIEHLVRHRDPLDRNNSLAG